VADCTCPKPQHDGRGYCERCKGFACEYADQGQTRCPAWRCDCFIEQYPDSPRALHPEAFIVTGIKRKEGER
jgi:hypothetical protein